MGEDTFEDDEFKNLKKAFLFDENSGLIRQGLSMKLYAKILHTESEDELDELINSVISSDNPHFEEE